MSEDDKRGVVLVLVNIMMQVIQKSVIDLKVRSLNISIREIRSKSAKSAIAL